MFTRVVFTPSMFLADFWMFSFFSAKRIKVFPSTFKFVNTFAKRQGRYVGKTSDWKKAIVTIDTNPSEQTYLAKGGNTLFGNDRS